MKQNKSLVICGQYKFPNCDAASRYYKNFSYLFDGEDIHFNFIGTGAKDQCICLTNEKYTYYTTRKFHGHNIFSKIFNHLYEKTKQMSLLKRKYIHCDYVIMDASFSKEQYDDIEKTFSKKNPNAKLFISVLEEYTQSEMDSNNAAIRMMIRNNNDLVNNYKNTKYSIIAISSFLAEKFKARGFRTFILPPLHSVDHSIEYSIKKTNHDLLNVCYLGNPGNKDNIMTLINAFQMLDSARKERINLTIYGVKNPKNFPINIKNVKIIGVVPYDIALEKYQTTDFTFLLRDPNEIFAKAGFPSKVSESFSCSTPVIANITSDLINYLEDDQNSIIINDLSVESVKLALERAIDKSKYELLVMQEHAKQTAINKLDTKIYQKSFIEFINN